VVPLEYVLCPGKVWLTRSISPWSTWRLASK